MFSTGANNPNGDVIDNNNQEVGHNNAAGSGGGGETSNPWGAGGPNGNISGDGKGSYRQSSSSLSWLTNLRKGVMNGGTSVLLSVSCPSRAEW